MSKMVFDGSIMKEYNDNGVLIYEGGYGEYEGEVIGLGIPVCKQGKGKEYFDDGSLKYEGNFKNGKYDGFGIFYKNWNYWGGQNDYQKYYEGERKEGKETGKGIVYELDPHGTKVRKLYEGDRVDGYWNGEGKIYGRLGTLSYEGEVFTCKGKFTYLGSRNGKGKSYYLDTETLEYEGEFKEGHFDGYGKLYSHPKPINVKGVFRGTGEQGKLLYEGYFKDGQYEGFGKYYYSDGNLCFVGDFKNGKWFHGKRYNSAGIIYDGDFNEDEEKHGKGKYIYEGVLYYDGEFQHNEIHGKGKLYDENGVLAYDGDFVESRREGNGKYYIDGKLVYDGERKDGIPLKPRDGYNKGEEDERYANDLCGRFWCQYTALQEHRKGTL